MSLLQKGKVQVARFQLFRSMSADWADGTDKSGFAGKYSPNLLLPLHLL